jgi:hypothetical protein
MITMEQISQLNSDSINISLNPDHTKSVFKELWDNSAGHQKIYAVALGSYEDIKPFESIKDSGEISVRMALVLAIVFGINPFYIIGKITEDNAFNETDLNEFLKNFEGFSAVDYPSLSIPSTDLNPTTNVMLTELVNNIIDNLEMTEELSLLEVNQLIKELNTQAQLKNFTATIKLSLIKRILEY